MRAALGAAWSYLAAVPGPQDRAVILVTDGQPMTTGTPLTPNANKSCGTLDDLTAETETAATASPSVRTFVIVLPGDANVSLMSSLAVRGKTAMPGCDETKDCHYQLGANDYDGALATATSDALARASRGCVFATDDEVVASPDELIVTERGTASGEGTTCRR